MPVSQIRYWIFNQSLDICCLGGSSGESQTSGAHQDTLSAVSVQIKITCCTCELQHSSMALFSLRITIDSTTAPCKVSSTLSAQSMPMSSIHVPAELNATLCTGLHSSCQLCKPQRSHNTAPHQQIGKSLYTRKAHTGKW